MQISKIKVKLITISQHQEHFFNSNAMETIIYACLYKIEGWQHFQELSYDTFLHSFDR